MPYVIRRDNPEGHKYKFSYFTGNSFPQQANRFDCTVRVPVFPSKKAVVAWVDALATHVNGKPLWTWNELELNGWELVQVRNRKVEGLMVHAINYNNSVRAISGATAIYIQALQRMPGRNHSLAISAAKKRLGWIKEDLANQYAKVKAKLLEDMKDAKSR